MDKLLHLPTLEDWEAIREDATVFAVWRQTIEERVNRLEKRMCKLEKVGKAKGEADGKYRRERIDSREREVV